MAHNPKALQTILQTAAPPNLDLAFRPMFGGIMAYADGKAFASLFDGGLALKLFGADREELLAVPGAKPLQYASDAPPSASYVVVPDGMLSARASLRAWIVRSAANLKPGKPRKRKVHQEICHGASEFH
jgi:TfoX/Sxy family transcriptional regulator of competence genes